MKFLVAQLLALLQERDARQNIVFLSRFISLLVLLIVIYSALFHYLMGLEGRDFSWITGLYWTLTVMSTLGFGDITFSSDAGKLFSILVMLSGVIFLLVMLPFTFIQYFWAPWLEVQKKRSIPRSLPENAQGHIILVGVNPLSLDLAQELKAYGLRAVILSPDSQTTLDLVAQGYPAVMGDHDSGETYKSLRIDEAAMLVAMDSDVRNTNIVFSAREVNTEIPIVAKVEHEAAIDILELAGSTRVFHFHKLLGHALARRVLHTGRRASVLNRFEHLEVVEAPLMRTGLVGKTLRHSGLRNETGVNVVGIWERGRFSLPTPDTMFSPNTVIVAAGTPEQVASLETMLAAGASESAASDSVVILGGGRVGQAAAEYLNSHGHECVVVEKGRHLSHSAIKHVQGDAAELEILEQAGLREAPAVLITTHDDDTNIYLTIYCRRLRPDIQIISRATFERNVGILHAAGADLVLSLSTMITNNVINMLSPGKVAMLNEGLNLFRCSAGENLAGKRLSESGIRDKTNCSVVAVRPAGGGELQVNPDPAYTFALGDKFYLIGDSTGESTCYELFGQDADPMPAEDSTEREEEQPPLLH